MTWLLFDTEGAAAAGEASISAAMGLPNLAEKTERWGVPRQVAEGSYAGRWAVAKPPSDALEDVEGYVEVEHSSDMWPRSIYSLPDGRPKILLDTDYDSDIDDVVDLTLLLRLEAMGECDIVGICVSSANSKAAPALLGHCNYYGRPDIPIGVNTADPGRNTSKYDASNAAAYALPGKTDATDFENAITDTYRRALATADENSITIVTSGGLNALKLVLASAADGYSDLSGIDLVKQKVRAIFITAGYWPSGPAISDMNTSRVDAAYIFANCPVPIILVGIELGNTVLTGGDGTITGLASDNPARAAWLSYFGSASPSNSRPGWAQIAILAAVRGLVGLVKPLGRCGTASVNTANGTTSWSPAEGRQSYLGKVMSDEDFVATINSVVGVNPAP